MAHILLTDKKPRTFDLPIAVVERIRAIAEDEKISMNDAASTLLAAAVELYDSGLIEIVSHEHRRRVTGFDLNVE